MQQHTMPPRLQRELWDFEDTAEWIGDANAYTKQYFTAGRQAHVRTTQSFGTPALVWHVAFWPTRNFDPHNLSGTGDPISRAEARREYDRLRSKLANDLDTRVLDKLQRRGRVK